MGENRILFKHANEEKRDNYACKYGGTTLEHTLRLRWLVSDSLDVAFRRSHCGGRVFFLLQGWQMC